MPYMIRRRDNDWCVYKEARGGGAKGRSLGCHDTERAARKQMAALYANENSVGDAFKWALLGLAGLAGYEVVSTWNKRVDQRVAKALRYEAERQAFDLADRQNLNVDDILKSPQFAATVKEHLDGIKAYGSYVADRIHDPEKFALAVDVMKAEDLAGDTAHHLSNGIEDLVLGKAPSNAPQAVKPPLRQKRWVTKLDARVRPAHRHAHGQTVPVGDLFQIDGHFARYPGDPRLPPELRMNCRCVTDRGPNVAVGFSVEERKMSPQREQGPFVQWQVDNVRATRLTRGDVAAVREYQMRGAEINGYLRRGEPINGLITALDAAIAKGVLKRDVVVHRGGLFGAALQVGDTFRDAAYVSATTSSAVAAEYLQSWVAEARRADLTPARIEIYLSAGQTVGVLPGAAVGDHSEVILPRDSTFRVLSIDGNGVLHAVLETP